MVFNFCGVLCLKFENGKFKISKLASVLNVIKMPLALLATVLISASETLQTEIFSVGIQELRDYSLFSKIIVMIIVYLEQLSAFALCSVNSWNRESCSNFMNLLTSFQFDVKFQKTFVETTKRNVLFTLVLTAAVASCQFFAAMKPSVLSCLAYMVLIFPYLVLMGFLTFMKTLEIFFTVLLKDFRHDLKAHRETCVDDVVVFQRLLAKHQKIYDLNEAFNKVFGNQVTVMTYCVVVMSTIQVLF